MLFFEKPDTDIIFELDVTALRSFEKHMSKTLKKISARIADLDASAARKKRSETQFNELRTIPVMVSDFLDQGFALDSAMRQTSQRMAGCPLETISAYWSKWIRSRDEQTKIERMILVTRMASRGYHNAEITDRTGIPDYTVSRIISKSIGKRRKDSNGVAGRLTPAP